MLFLDLSLFFNSRLTGLNDEQSDALKLWLKLRQTVFGILPPILSFRLKEFFSCQLLSIHLQVLHSDESQIFAF